MRSLKALIENPVQVSGQPPNTTYANWPKMGSHVEMIIAPIAPGSPHPSFRVKSQERPKCRISVTTARYMTMAFLLCDCRNIWRVKTKI